MLFFFLRESEREREREIFCFSRESSRKVQGNFQKTCLHVTLMIKNAIIILILILIHVGIFDIVDKVDKVNIMS